VPRKNGEGDVIALVNIQGNEGSTDIYWVGKELVPKQLDGSYNIQITPKDREGLPLNSIEE
jgi:hypothetical protein